MSPKVSVIIPCYRQTKYLDECIMSVLAQTYQDFEIIVVDDGAIDSDEVEFFKKIKYPKTRVVHQENKGLSAARNFGIENAIGDFILPLDADDKISDRFLELTVPVLESKKSVGIVGGGTEFFGDKTGIFKLRKYGFPSILRENCLVCTQLFRRKDWEMVGGYHTNMIYGLEDWDFWLSIIELNRSVVQIEGTLFYYRKHGVSMLSTLTDDQGKYKKAILQILLNHQKLFERYYNYRDFHLGKPTHGFRSSFPRLLCRVMRKTRINRYFEQLYDELCFIP